MGPAGDVLHDVVVHTGSTATTPAVATAATNGRRLHRRVVISSANSRAAGLIPWRRSGEASEQFKEKLGAAVLFPERLGTPAEYASLAWELLANSYLNAESIRLDAGIRMQPK